MRVVVVFGMVLALALNSFQTIADTDEMILNVREPMDVAVTDRNIIAIGFDGESSEIYIQNTATGELIKSTSSKNGKLQLAGSGNYVGWVERVRKSKTRGNNNDIFIMDARTNEIIFNSNSSGNESRPEISGNLAVWMEVDRSGKTVFYEYNLANKELSVIANKDNIFTSDFAVVEGKVVWIERTSMWEVRDVYCYDPATLKTTQVTTDGKLKQFCCAAKEWFFWFDFGKDASGGGDIYGFNASNGKVYPVETSDVYPIRIDSDGDTFVMCAYSKALIRYIYYRLDLNKFKNTEVKLVEVAKTDFYPFMFNVSGNTVFMDNRRVMNSRMLKLDLETGEICDWSVSGIQQQLLRFKSNILVWSELDGKNAVVKWSKFQK